MRIWDDSVTIDLEPYKSWLGPELQKLHDDTGPGQNLWDFGYTEIKDDVLTITPAESSCPGSIGIIDGGEASGTSVRPRPVGCLARALTRD